MIRVQDLCKKFGDLTAVDHVSFDVHSGEIFAFLGPNGAGKTTTIKMLTTLLSPTAGIVEIDGLDVSAHSQRGPPAIRHRLSGPEPRRRHDRLRKHGAARRLLSRAAQDRARERIEHLLRLFELWERRKDQVKLFSGGMKRRLEIARGLLHTPKILFLDEPTLGLDPQTRNQLWTHVKHLNQTEGVTVFLTTHYMDEAERVAQRIAIIDHGKIVAQGSPQELKQQTGKDSLEDAFLALTGSTIRDEVATSADQMQTDGEAMGEPPMSAIYILWLRELRRYVRSRAQIVASLGQPMLYLVALGFGLGPVFQKAGQGNYVQFVAPGIIGMTVLFSSVFSGIGLLWDRQFGFLKETLVAPVPRIQVMLGQNARRAPPSRSSKACSWRWSASSPASGRWTIARCRSRFSSWL